MSKKVYVGMSGGVDSSVTAALLKQRGYNVTGVYMKNWSQDLPGHTCPWKEDYQDAKRVAVRLGIPFKMYDFETQYRQRVVDYMVAEYRAGRTPNPDIMCNQEIKFKLFLDTALADGADLIATGHYARVENEEYAVKHAEGRTKNKEEKAAKSPHSSFRVPYFVALRTGLDPNKDQSYFLARVSEAALAKSLMPIGELYKPQVRELARRFGLATADKKDSQGICFVGKVGIKEFLLAELGPQPPGPIINQKGENVGQHDGAIFYTIGQRHGLQVGGGLPFYVTGKDMVTNTVRVTTNLQDEKLWRRDLTLTDVHWINGQAAETTLSVRTRYRVPVVQCQLTPQADNRLQLELAEEVRALTPGQSAVLYRGDQVVGAGVVV